MEHFKLHFSSNPASRQCALICQFSYKMLGERSRISLERVLVDFVGSLGQFGDNSYQRSVFISQPLVIGFKLIESRLFCYSCKQNDLIPGFCHLYCQLLADLRTLGRLGWPRLCSCCRQF